MDVGVRACRQPNVLLLALGLFAIRAEASRSMREYLARPSVTASEATIRANPWTGLLVCDLTDHAGVSIVMTTDL
jgi:hypothetical protein